MPLIDISRTLNPHTAVWPGDTPFRLETVLSQSQGDSVTLTTLRLSAHTGTHVDAPRHFSAQGESLTGLELTPYWGRAQVVTVSKERGALTPEDLPASVEAPRLLVRSRSSGRDPHTFDRDIVYPSPELADFLGGQGVVLYGTDAPSVDEVDSKTLPGHGALYRNGIAILEGVNLSDAPDGFYELVALPLKIAGGDGSPVRAVLREA